MSTSVVAGRGSRLQLNDSTSQFDEFGACAVPVALEFAQQLTEARRDQAQNQPADSVNRPSPDAPTGRATAHCEFERWEGCVAGFRA